MDINQFTPKSLAELKDFIITEAINKVLQDKFKISFNEVIESVKKECNLNFYNDYEKTIVEKLNSVKITNNGHELSGFVDKKR
jgi:Leu/Phe-tRNA-protein transferase